MKMRWVIQKEAEVELVAIMYGSGALGGQMYSAGFQALYCMAKKGKFTLKTTSNPFGLFSVSWGDYEQNNLCVNCNTDLYDY